MSTDFERKLRRIILNDQNMGRTISLEHLQRWTGHDQQEIKAILKKLRQIPVREGGLGS